MAEFNFKITEDQRPGGGVYMIGELSGGTTSITLRQAEYPTIDLSRLTKDNFFLKTTCNASDTASVTTDAPMNVSRDYIGGKVTHSYSYSNGAGTITVNETLRKAKVERYTVGSGGTYKLSEKDGSYTHKVYMTREAIRY